MFKFKLIDTVKRLSIAMKRQFFLNCNFDS